MPKNVADDLCGRATFDLETGVRVAKDVGANAAADTSGASVISDAVSDRRGRHPDVRHRTLDEERSTRCGQWASSTEIPRHRPCDGR
jgi:hypothetical protein